MNHADHVRLIKKGITQGGVWAELGSGRGAFTLALREVAGPGVKIYSVDKDGGSLAVQKTSMERQFLGTNITYIEADFTHDLSLPPLDGVLTANSLHFVTDQIGLLKRLIGMVRANGRLMMVEYNSEQGNNWVPYPVSYKRLRSVALQAGWQPPELLATVPSVFLKEIYAAVLVK